MSFISRHTPSRIGAGIGGAARINQAEEIVGIPWLYQLALEGRVFIAGNGLEETEFDSDDSGLDEEAGIVLAAPTSGTLIVPLYFRAYLDTTVAYVPRTHLCYMQANKAWGASTGTAMVAINCLGGTSPRTAAAKVFTEALCSTTTDDENVVLHERIQLLVSFIQTEGATTKQGIEFPGTQSSMEFCWQPEFPIVLAEGSALFFNAYSGTTATEFNYTVSWAELDSSVYGL